MDWSSTILGLEKEHRAKNVKHVEKERLAPRKASMRGTTISVATGERERTCESIQNVRRAMIRVNC